MECHPGVDGDVDKFHTAREAYESLVKATETKKAERLYHEMVRAT